MNEPNTANSTVLVLADDQPLRQIVARTLARAGLMVLETRSSKEAERMAAQNKPAVIFLDSILKDTNACQWFREQRQQGVKTPFVIFSESCIDRRKVMPQFEDGGTLLLQKPIIAELLLQQIEPIFPHAAMNQIYEEEQLVRMAPLRAHGEIKRKSPAVTRVDLRAMSSKPRTENDELIEPDPDAEDQSGEMMRTLSQALHKEQEQVLERDLFAKSLTSRTQELVQSLHRFAAQPDNRAGSDGALQLAHRLRVTAASFNMLGLSEAAGQIEDLLLGLREAEDESYQIIWSQIRHSIEEIKILSAVASSLPASVTDFAYLPRRIILLGDAKRFAKESAELSASGTADTIILNSIDLAQRRMGAGNVDGIVIDFGLEHSDEILSFITSIRVQQTQAPPFALIGEHARALQPHERLYLGSSLTLDGNSDPLATYARYLIAMSAINKSQVITVVDDVNLHEDIEAALSCAGMSVTNLTDPTQILQELDRLKPDAVIIKTMLPGVSGFDLGRLIKSSTEHKRVPVLYLGNQGSRAAMSASFASGGCDLLAIPVVPEQLVMRVKEQVRLYKQTQVGNEIGEDGLYTRRAIVSKLEQSAGAKGLISLAMFAITKFDVIGLRHGLRAQEATCGLACELLRSRFRYQDWRGRWSDSTFMVVFPDQPIGIAGAAISLLCEEFARCELTSSAGTTFRPSLSFGLSTQERAKLEPDLLLDSAYRHLNAATFA